MEANEADYTETTCDGGDGALGHPRIYLKVGKEKETVCPYCSRRYLLADNDDQD